MVYLLSVVIALLIPVNSIASYLPQSNTLVTANNCNVSIPSGAIRLYAEYNTGSPPYYSTFYKTNGTAYQVTTGKTFKYLSFQIIITNFTSNSYMQLGYADTATVAGGSTSAPTTPVILGNSSDASRSVYYTSATAFNFTQANTACLMGLSVPASKYPLLKMVNGNGTGYITVIGYEE